MSEIFESEASQRKVTFGQSYGTYECGNDGSSLAEVFVMMEKINRCIKH